MEVLRSHLSKVRIPEPSNRIYKQECCISFCTPVWTSFPLLMWFIVSLLCATFWKLPARFRPNSMSSIHLGFIHFFISDLFTSVVLSPLGRKFEFINITQVKYV